MKTRKILLLTAFSLIVSSIFSGCSLKSQKANELPQMCVYRLMNTRPKDPLDINRLFVEEPLKIDNGETPVEAVMNTLNTVPSSSEYKNLFPTGIRILSANLKGGVVRVEMNDSYLILMGIDQSLADYGICLSFCSLPNVKSIDIFAGGSRIKTELKPTDLVLSNSVISDNEAELRLYFPKSDGSGLGLEYRHVNLNVDDSAERCIMDALLSGPKTDGLRPIAGHNTFLLSIYTQDGVCSVDFSEDFLSDAELTEEETFLILSAVESSLIGLANVESVLIYVDGKPVSINSPEQTPEA